MDSLPTVLTIAYVSMMALFAVAAVAAAKIKRPARVRVRVKDNSQRR